MLSRTMWLCPELEGLFVGVLATRAVRFGVHGNSHICPTFLLCRRCRLSLVARIQLLSYRDQEPTQWEPTQTNKAQAPVVRNGPLIAPCSP